MQTAHKAHDCDAQTAWALVDAEATAGKVFGEVGRTQDIGIAVHDLGDLHFVPCVVAQSDHIGTGVVDVLSLLGRNAHH